MGKAARTPVIAAGGIVIRHGGRPLIAIVQRRRDNAWVLPKGKLKPNERPKVAAKREATEETGVDVRVHEFLGVISYLGDNGQKIVHFWRMRALDGPVGKPMDDIKAVEWLSLSAATERLTLSHEQLFLRNVGRKALKRAMQRTLAKRPTRAKAARANGGTSATAKKARRRKAQASPGAAQHSPPRSTTRSRESVAPTPRWDVLSRLTKRWQAAVALTRRMG